VLQKFRHRFIFSASSCAWLHGAEMEPLTRYTLRHNSASVLKNLYDFGSNLVQWFLTWGGIMEHFVSTKTLLYDIANASIMPPPGYYRNLSAIFKNLPKSSQNRIAKRSIHPSFRSVTQQLDYVFKPKSAPTTTMTNNFLSLSG